MNMASSSPPELRLTSAIATRMRDGLGVVVGRPESCAPRHSRWLHGQPQGPGTRRRSRSSMSNNADEGNGRHRGEHRETGDTGGSTGHGGRHEGEGGRGEHRGGERARGTGAEGNTAGELGHGAWGQGGIPRGSTGHGGKQHTPRSSNVWPSVLDRSFASPPSRRVSAAMRAPGHSGYASVAMRAPGHPREVGRCRRVVLNQVVDVDAQHRLGGEHEEARAARGGGVGAAGS